MLKSSYESLAQIYWNGDNVKKRKISSSARVVLKLVLVVLFAPICIPYTATRLFSGSELQSNLATFMVMFDMIMGYWINLFFHKPVAVFLIMLGCYLVGCLAYEIVHHYESEDD